MGSTELAVLRDLFLGLGRMDPGTPVDQQRAAADALGSMFPLEQGVVVEPVDIPGIAGEWVFTVGDGAGAGDGGSDGASGDRRGRVVLYLHGGGYVIGSPASHRAWAAKVAAASGARVLVLDYRLAPEHPYPAALEDTVGAYDALLAAGYRPGAIALAGDSAGGGLALSAAVAARDAGSALPGAIVCVSPWVDLRCTAPSVMARDARDYVLSGAWLRAMAGHYLDGTGPDLPSVSPIEAELAGLPPVLVAVGTEEVLYDDAVGIGERLRASGVPTELEVFADCAHWWIVTGPLLPETAACAERIARFLGDRLAPLA